MSAITLDAKVDNTTAILDALENIVDAGIEEKLTLMLDSGVRGASARIKAPWVGAKFVLVGRLWVNGFSGTVEEGARHVNKKLGCRVRHCYRGWWFPKGG